LEGGSWRIVQQELSPLGEARGLPAGGAPAGSASPAAAALAGRASGAVGTPVLTDEREEQGEGGGADATSPSRLAGGARASDAAAGGVAAQQGAILDAEIFGPPPPVPPAVIARDAEGNATVRAIRLEAPLDIDGRLDEPVYAQVPPLDGFVQSIPDEGEPATERTEAWVMFDDENVYVSARMHDRAPESEWVANEMRRDLIRTNDNFGLIFDTYYDRRNGYFFYVNPLGGFSDIQVTNEGSPNFDWNPIWDVRTGRFDGGWTVEMQFPFKSLRYRPGTSQVWGLQLRRMIRRRNETSLLTPIPRAAAGALGSNAILRLSRAATLVGIEAPPQGVNLDVKPYGIAGLTTDMSAASPTRNELDGDGGVDVKWAATQNLAADFTYNTDFAQVEVDEQQVNLTRYSLVFPEKREFFLESRGIFNYPAGTAGGGGGGSGGSVPQVFFSRRIGLLEGVPVPILGGGRLTGKLGPFDVGALNIQTQEHTDVGAEPTNFTAVRLRADVLSRSNLGAIFTRRSRSVVTDGWSHTYGGDASFSFLDDLYLTGFYALTHTPELAAADARTGQSYQGRLSYEGDLQGFGVSHLLVEDDFNPEVGLVRRSGFRQTQASLRTSPRPSISWIRQATLQGNVDYLENARQGFVETREISASLGIELENSDQLNLGYTDSYEYLALPEQITGASIPAGRYSFDAVDASFSFGPQRFFSGSLSVRHGDFYDGRLTSAGFNRGRIEILRQLSVEPGVSFNWVRLPNQSFNTTLASTRVTYTFSPRMFFSALVQYNSSADSFSANARLRWEYAPGSEIFLVFTEERDTYDWQRFPGLVNRGLVVKATRLLRF
ncbi:MAG TPA: DUF5916 domain-containing protein, partial [Gemmatimonadota bacterium]|nr:DUF5916 domain-containing protein [Gemmatimonadota bacterium]